MPGCATTVVAWRGAAAGVNADVLRRASQRAGITYQRDGRRPELPITYALYP